MTHYPPSRPIHTNNSVPTLGAVIEFYLELNHLTGKPRWMHMDRDRIMEIAWACVKHYEKRTLSYHRAGDLIQAISLHKQVKEDRKMKLQKALQ